jgi:hypothetical protein
MQHFQITMSLQQTLLKGGLQPMISLVIGSPPPRELRLDLHVDVPHSIMLQQPPGTPSLSILIVEYSSTLY